jgi:nucleoside-diphosphate-sugar epimerase
MKAHLLVTGANSFIGSSFIRQLIEYGETDIVATYRYNKEALVDPQTTRLKYVYCDLSNPKSVSQLFDENNIGSIVHFAAARSGKTEENFSSIADRDNIQPIKNLLKMAAKMDCKRFIFTSAIAVYDGMEKTENEFLENVPLSPTSTFGQSKLACENLLRQYGGRLERVSLRLPGVHGPGKNKGVVYQFLKAALYQTPLKITEPDSRFRLLFIKDAIQSILLALREELSDSYCCYNVASSEIFNLVDLAKKILEVTKSNSPINLEANTTYRNQVVNIDRIQNDLHFNPAPIMQHLSIYLDFLQGNNKQCM